MKANRFSLAAIFGLVLLLVGCSQPATFHLPAAGTPRPGATVQVSSPPAASAAPTHTVATQMPPSQPALPSQDHPPAPGLEGMIEKAKQDLAARLSVPLAQISLVEAAAVVWPDASVGCPQPGMLYIQVPQDGTRIILQVAGSRYAYHVGGSRGLFLCEMVYKDPNPPPRLDIPGLTPAVPDNSIPPGADK